MNDMTHCFRAAMQADGLDFEGEIISDGRLHRIKCKDDRNRNAWYILHDDGLPAGSYGHWKTGQRGTWCAKVTEELTDAERAERDRRWRQQQAEREADRRRHHDEARQKAQAILDAADDATEEHPYLRRKGVKAYPGVKIGDWPQGKRVNCLLIPLHNQAGQLATVQAIAPERDPTTGRDKDFLKGGAKSGAFFVIGDPLASEVILLAEGYATAATLHEATGYAAVMACDAGNLKAVAIAFKSNLFPKKPLIVCADNDRHTEGNPGLTAACKIKDAYPGTSLVQIAVPEFSDDEDGSDFNDLAARRGLDAVREAIAETLSKAKATRSPSRQSPEASSSTHSPETTAEHTPADDYPVNAQGSWWIKRSDEGEKWVFLANFSARIQTETVVDDGVERKRHLEMTGQLGNQALPTITVPSGQFSSLNWVNGEWGSAVQIAPGFGLKDRLRYAIQVRSSAVSYRTVFAHTGWRKIDQSWVYLSNGVCMSAAGAVAGIDMLLPGVMGDYALTAPDAPPSSIAASLQVLDCAPWSISGPLFLAPYRALLGEALPVDFSLFLYGPTGCRKTELAALAQGHFGSPWHGKHLPAAWSSTANSLERTAFLAKDAVLVVDDFCPHGNATDVARYHKDADRLLRAQGNRAGRQRMNADGSLRPAYYPRGLILATGEDVPRGQSLRGRLLVLELSAESVNLEALTLAQQAARTGQLASATAAFCQWLAPRLDDLKATLPVRFREQRASLAAHPAAHTRHPETLAGLLLTAELFAQFATEAGVNLPPDWLATLTDTLLQAGIDQAQFIATEEPASRFVRLIQSALASGRCHVKPLDGRALSVYKDFTQYGWQLKTFGVGEHERTDWHECGPAIGRFKPDEPGGLLLDPESSYALAQKIAQEQGQAIPLQQRSLFKALAEKGYLIGRNMPHYTIKTKLPDKTTQRFLSLRVYPQNYGNYGNYGNQSAKYTDLTEENRFPLPENASNRVGTSGNRCVPEPPPVPTREAGSHSPKSEWEPENELNTLNCEDKNMSVPIVPIVPINSHIPPQESSDLSDSFLKSSESATGPVARQDATASNDSGWFVP